MFSYYGMEWTCVDNEFERPVTEPCGIQKWRKQLFEDIPSMLTTWEWPDKYDWNHCNAVPVTPTCILNWKGEIRIAWFMVSRVALKSRRMRMTLLDLSREEKMSFQIFSKPVSLLCMGLYADWDEACTLWVFMWFDSCFMLAFPIFFETNDILKMGQ